MATVKVTISQIPERIQAGPGTAPLIEAVLYEDSKEVKFYILQVGQQTNIIVKNFYRIGIKNIAAPCSTKKLFPKDGDKFLQSVKPVFEENRGHTIATRPEELKKGEVINDRRSVEKFFGTIQSINQTEGTVTVLGSSCRIDWEWFRTDIPITCFLEESQTPEVKKNVQALLIFEKTGNSVKEVGVIAAAVVTPDNYPLFAKPSLEEDLMNWAQTIDV